MRDGERIEKMVAATAGIQRGVPPIGVGKKFREWWDEALWSVISEGREMTDNEKAATFIGWRPEKGCFDWCEDPNCPHANLAPNMTDPRNYMKALEELGTNGYDYVHSFAPGAKLNDNHYFQIGHGFSHEAGIKDEVARAFGKSFGDTVIVALAALYDAEHADNARTKG